MKSETLKALQGSIQKWQNIVDGTGVDAGIENCPLCEIFNLPNGCRGCPVREKVDTDYCGNTPFFNWAQHHFRKHYCRPSKVYSDCLDCERLAKAELEFLKSLLPVEKEKTMRKIEIYEEKEKVVVEEEPIRLKITEMGGRIDFEAVDRNGKRLSTGNLFSLTSAGIYLYGSINGDVGFSVDDNGQIKIRSNT